MLRELTVKNIGSMTYDLPVNTAYQARKEAKRRFGDDLVSCAPVPTHYKTCERCGNTPCCGCPPKE
jgi:hypothetical protein